MKKFWIVIVLAAVAISLGCGGGGSGAEAAAKKILEAAKKGDQSVMMDHLDLKGMYEKQVPEDQREAFPYEKFEEMLKKGAEGKKEAPEGFDYDILGSETKDDLVIVKVKVKENKDAEWKESEVPFKEIDGKWKITAAGFEQLMKQ